jgi:hypothetical protein
VANLSVTIDPTIPGQSKTLRLGDITAQHMLKAVQAADAAVPLSGDMAVQRFHDAVAMHLLDDQGANKPVSTAPMQPTPRNRVVSPLQALHAATAPVAAAANGHLVASDPVQAPTCEALFEIEHFGTLTAYYHDIVVSPGFMVLVYDTRCRNANRYFPEVQTGEKVPQLALHIKGGSEIYLVQTTGIQYIYKEYEFCVLLVERQVTAEVGD